MANGWATLRRTTAALASAVLGSLGGSTALAQETVMVDIQNYTYLPAQVKIRPGDTVRWTNKEKRTSHSILFPAEGGLESDRIFPEETWQRTFPQAGSYPYTCGPHPEMKGLVVVSE